jgi:uncharacterized protein DUF4333
MRRHLAAALSALIFALVLSGCPVKKEQLEEDAQEFVEKRGMNVDSVTCPDDLESDLGAKVECRVDVGADTVSVEIEVIRTGGDGSDADTGDVEYRLRFKQ